MSFFKLDDTANISDDNIKYIYTGTSVNKRDITEHSNDELLNSIKKADLPETEGKRIPVKNTFYKINFVNREPNFTFAGMSPSSYVANTMYLYGLLHRNISGVTTKNGNIIGEIVIEHANANKQAQKVFTCFLVEEQSDKTTDNSVDTLVKMVTGEGAEPDITVELNTIIPKQTSCVRYVDGDNHVFLFTTPLQVNKPAANFFRNKLSVNTKLFKVYPPTEYNVINMDKEKKAQEGFTLQEGATGEIYIDCQPTGESAETIQAYAVPINSAYGDSKNQIDFFKMMINFGVFLIISILTYFTIPPFYKHVVVDKINRQYEKDGRNIRQQFIYIADLWIIGMFIISIVDAFYGGIAKTGHYSLMQYGIGLCVVLIVSYALIQMNKLHPAYMTTGDIESTYPDDPTYHPSTGGIRNIGQFFLDLYLKPLAQDNGKTFAKIFVIWALVVTIPGLFLASYASEKVSSTWFKRLIPASIFALTPAIYLSATP